MEKYRNKRIMLRGHGGKFRKATMQDMGIGGVCPVCRHLLIRHYDGDTRAEFLDPRKFVYRCFTCNPLSEAEQALEAEIAAEKPKPVSLMDVFSKALGK